MGRGSPLALQVTTNTAIVIRAVPKSDKVGAKGEDIIRGFFLVVVLASGVCSFNQLIRDFNMPKEKRVNCFANCLLAASGFFNQLYAAGVYVCARESVWWWLVAGLSLSIHLETVCMHLISSLCLCAWWCQAYPPFSVHWHLDGPVALADVPARNIRSVKQPDPRDQAYVKGRLLEIHVCLLSVSESVSESVSRRVGCDLV